MNARMIAAALAFLAGSSGVSFTRRTSFERGYQKPPPSPHKKMRRNLQKQGPREARGRK